MKTSLDSLGCRRSLRVGGHDYAFYSLDAAEAAGAGPVTRLPHAAKVLFENLLRHEDGVTVTRDHLAGFAAAVAGSDTSRDIWFHPTRILMNDSAGIPLMADFAALRGAMATHGGDPARINPQLQADLVVDHSVMVDHFASAGAVAANLDREYQRNDERYRFLRWAEQAFANFRVVPPGTGICHQVNLEALARCVWSETRDDGTDAFPETLLGTDSHTPMINGIGVLGWGVGGIEAGAAMLGQPVTMTVPRVVGCRLDGRLATGVSATDLVLGLTERLRRVGVVGAFVEFFGPGLAALSLSDRATIANMAPEYGATMGFFPWDEEVLRYLAQTDRGGAHLELVEAYGRAQGLWHDPSETSPDYPSVVAVDLGEIVPAIAGPRRPQERIPLTDAARRFAEDVAATLAPLPAGGAPVEGHDWTLDHGDVVVAAITSCTNTSNPTVMLAAGLLARNAVARGLAVKPWVKTSLAPGSRVVTDYLEATGLQDALDRLGFQCVGYGCTTCMGNSGPLAPAIAAAIETHGVAAAAVLSGNRNFEGRVHPHAKINYIGSPPLVIAYAIAGTMRHDLMGAPLGHDPAGRPVHLADIWPGEDEIRAVVEQALTPERFRARYGELYDGDARWRKLEAPTGELFAWPEASLYMTEPPFFADLDGIPAEDIEGARILALLGDSITTDHLSPVGTITAGSAAGRHLVDQGVAPLAFNSFAARRVNHEVMRRGAFANIRIQNDMVPDRQGGWTRHQPSGEVMAIHAAADRYAREGVPLVVVAGDEYGTGSSRDWAAKGTRILGVRAILAEGFERIHRANLVGMGVLPLQFPQGTNRRTLGLDGSETVAIRGLAHGLGPGTTLTAVVTDAAGESREVPVRCRLDTPIEVAYYRAGGILHHVLRGALGHHGAEAA